MAEDDTEEEVKHIVRISKTNLDGQSTVEHGLTGIKGIGQRTARTLADSSGIEPGRTLGRLEEDEVEELNDAVENAGELLPDFMVNRRRDPFTGEDRHVIGGDLDLANRQDLERMKKMRSYKGIRHIRGQKVRGQRTRSTGRTGSTVGVDRAQLREEAEEEAAAEEEGAEEGGLGGGEE